MTVPGSTLSVPATEYPAGFVFYKMGHCGFLRGLHETQDISPQWQFVVIDDDGRRSKFTEKYRQQPTIKFTHVPQEFGRLLAKIGYCNALTILGPDDFQPLALPYIMGDKTNVSYIVGSADGSPEPDNGYRMTTGYSDQGDRIVIATEIRLYANTHAPTYHVIVGVVTGADAITKAKAKLEPGPNEEFGLLRF